MIIDVIGLRFNHLMCTGAVIVVPVFSYFLQLSDNVLNLIANIAIAASNMLLAFAPTWKYLYIGRYFALLSKCEMSYSVNRRF